jgi:hypothetical protein
LRALLMILPLAAATAAAAQTAPPRKDILIDAAGHHYCFKNGADLRERDGGGERLTIPVTIPLDLTHADTPGVIAASDDFQAAITVTYRAVIGADGKPAAAPAPYKLMIGLGGFAGTPPRPIESLSVVVSAGGKAFAPIPLGPSGYSAKAPVAGVTAEAKAFDSVAWQPADVDAFAHALTGGASTIALLQNGKPLTSVAVAKPDIVPQIDAALAWSARNAALLAAHKDCD